MKYYLIISVLFLTSCKVHRQCSLYSKGIPLITIHNGDDGWAYPDEVCALISKSISESTESTRTELFGFGADEWSTLHPCVCTE